MDVTTLTWIVAAAGLLLMAILGGAQLIAVTRPHSDWTIQNVYGGSPDGTDPRAYFAFNQGYAWADTLLWAPVQFVASLGMITGEQWGFLLGLVAAVPYVYTAVTIFVWDRDMGFRKPGWTYWVFTWGMFPAYGLVLGLYCFARLLA